MNDNDRRECVQHNIRGAKWSLQEAKSGSSARRATCGMLASTSWPSSAAKRAYGGLP